MMTIRPAAETDLSALVEIYNHYILHTPITFDLQPYTLEQRRPWFDEHAANVFRKRSWSRHHQQHLDQRKLQRGG